MVGFYELVFLSVFKCFLNIYLDLTSNTRISKEKLEEIYEEFEYYWKNNRLASITLKDEYLKIMPKELKKEVIFFFLSWISLIIFKIFGPFQAHHSSLL